jgi:hypothetical protein
MKRRTEITIETERVVVMGGGEREDIAQWCEKCGARSRLIAPGAAAALLRVSAHAILRWAEAAGLHFVESADGPALLCLGSLPHDAGGARAAEGNRGDADDLRGSESALSDRLPDGVKLLQAVNVDGG